MVLHLQPFSPRGKISLWALFTTPPLQPFASEPVLCSGQTRPTTFSCFFLEISLLVFVDTPPPLPNPVLLFFFFFHWGVGTTVLLRVAPPQPPTPPPPQVLSRVSRILFFCLFFFFSPHLLTEPGPAFRICTKTSRAVHRRTLTKLSPRPLCFSSDRFFSPLFGEFLLLMFHP